MSNSECRICGKCRYDEHDKLTTPCVYCRDILGHPNWEPKEEERVCDKCLYSINGIGINHCSTCINDIARPSWEPKEEDLVFKEMVVHPLHYTQGKHEVIDVIYDWQLNFALGSVLKYIARLDTKEKPIEDLKKAIQYLEFEIQEREKINETR